jgi:hypothetical protein
MLFSVQKVLTSVHVVVRCRIVGTVVDDDRVAMEEERKLGVAMSVMFVVVAMMTAKITP